MNLRELLKKINWKKVFIIIAYLLVICSLALIAAIISSISKSGQIIWDWENFGKPLISIAVLGPLGPIVIFFWERIVNIISPKDNKFFSTIWKASNKLIPEEVFGPIRSLPQKGYMSDFYYERDEDIRLKEQLEKSLDETNNSNYKKNVLIYGRPLSGKTRLIFNWLKQQSNLYVLIPHYSEINLSTFDIPKPPLRKSKKILLLDDLQRYVEFENFNYLLNQALTKQDINIIATCRSEIEYQKVNNWFLRFFNFDLDSIFSNVEISTITEEKAQEITNQVNKKWENVSFDGTIGSIFLELKEMERRYNENCGKDERAILKSMKIAHNGGLYDEKTGYPMAWVKKIYQHYFDPDFTLKDWNWSIEQLDLYEFINIVNDTIKIEQVYIEKIIDPSFQDSIENFLKLREIFSDDFEALLLIGLRIVGIGLTIEVLEYYEEAIKLLDFIIKNWKKTKHDEYILIKAHILKANILHYKGTTFGKSEPYKDWDKAIETLQSITQNKSITISPFLQGEINVILINTLASKAGWFLYAEKITKDKEKKKYFDDILKALIIIDECIKIYTLQKYPLEYAKIMVIKSNLLLTLAMKVIPNRNDKLFLNMTKTELAEKALAIQLELLNLKEINTNKPFISNLKRNIGVNYRENFDDYDLSIKYLQESIDPTITIRPRRLALIIQDIGSAYSLKGEVKEAISYLRKSLETSILVLDYVKKNPCFDSLRELTEYKSLIQEYEEKESK